MRSPQEEGGVFTIGDVTLEVAMKQTCEIMEGKREGLRRAMTPGWRGGVCCVVKSGSAIALLQPFNTALNQAIKDWLCAILDIFIINDFKC